MSATLIHFHLSLNVSDLTQSVTFYRTLFGQEPAKLRSDYAKFETIDPPLVLSLEASARPLGGPLNHVGFRLPDAKFLVEMQHRLEANGIHSNREEGVECCYAKQTKFWVTDPDGTLWEMYTFEGDLDHRGPGQTVEAMLPQAKPAIAEQVVWEHRLGQPIPKQLPYADQSVDEIHLRGSLNIPLSEQERDDLLAEALRVLKPNGRLFIHVLTAERAMEGEPGLTGPAASVRHTPMESEPGSWLADAGFQSIRMLKFDAKPCFVRNGIGMRELQLEGFKPFMNVESEHEVMYKGPFEQVIEANQIFPRGVRVWVTGSLAQRFRSPEWAIHFVVFESSSTRPVHTDTCG